LAVAPLSWHNHHAAYIIHSFEKIYTRCVMRCFWVWSGLGKLRRWQT
jgi:hypothetical protein